MMGIVFVRCDAPKVAPLLWETLGVIAGSSPVVPADSVHSSVPVGFAPGSFLQRMVCSISGMGPPGACHRGWDSRPGKQTPGLKTKEG